MTRIQSYEVGRPWPHPIQPAGLQMLAEPIEDGVGVMLVAAVPHISGQEITALTESPIRLGILPSPPIVYVLLSADGLSLDAPYAVGLHDAALAGALRAGVGLARSWPDDRRGTLTIAVVDGADRILRGLRMVSLSRTWWVKLAAALDRCGPVTPAALDAEMARAYRRYPDVAAMMHDATIVETAGRV